jgi:Holliday junction DNA helicase RuvB
LVKRVADFALVKYNGIIDENVANESLDILKIDKFGLDTTDRALLNLIIDKYDGGPVGIETIAAALSEDVRTIEDVCEPYLLQIGYLKRTPRGRVVTELAYKHLDIERL